MPYSVVKVWIADTGVANDIVAELAVLGLALKKAGLSMVFDTANGEVKADKVCPMKLRLIGKVIAPYVVKDSPALMSAGARVMGLGWHFIWLGHK